MNPSIIIDVPSINPSSRLWWRPFSKHSGSALLIFSSDSPEVFFSPDGICGSPSTLGSPNYRRRISKGTSLREVAQLHTKEHCVYIKAPTRFIPCPHKILLPSRGKIGHLSAALNFCFMSRRSWGPLAEISSFPQGHALFHSHWSISSTSQPVKTAFSAAVITCGHVLVM